jgi:4-hydroxy-L-threonine phosphate dehydrogenase PdxA
VIRAYIAITVFRKSAEIMSPPRNVTIHREGIEIIANAIEKCDEESRQKRLFLPINKATERAAMYNVHGEISVIYIKNQEETQGKECY